MVVVSISKEERLAGKNGEIVGNYQDLDQRAPATGNTAPPAGKFTPSAKPRF